jgi:hypothetical protein
MKTIQLFQFEVAIRAENEGDQECFYKFLPPKFPSGCGDDFAHVLQAMQAPGRSVPVSKTASRMPGIGTIAVLKGPQTELGTVSGINNARICQGDS